MNRSSSGFSRRRFLSATGTVLALPVIVPASVMGRADRPAPSERISLGMIGCGSQGTSNARAFLRQKACQVVAACDVDKTHLGSLVGVVNRQYQSKTCRVFHDYRELLAREDIDAVMIATPDHWHALAAIEAARRKKDIYGEKPLARTVAAETAHHSAIPGHLGLISMLVGRKIKCDPQAEHILDDPEASKLLGRQYRPPWTLG
jgi:hypothetical protein